MTPTVYSAEWISGDEHLKDAIIFTDYIMNNDPNDRMFYIGLFDGRLTAPGQAVFRIRMGGEDLYYETDYTLTVLSWTEEPLFELKDGYENVYIEGGNLENQFYNILKKASLIMTDHFDELSSVHPAAGVKTYYRELSANTSVRDESKVKERMGGSGYFWQFRDYGAYEFSVEYQFGNVYYYSWNFTVNILPYYIRAKGQFSPGGSVHFSVQDEQPESGRTFYWTLEGKGVSFNSSTQVLIIPDSVPEGTTYQVTATPFDGGEPVRYNGVVYSGTLVNPKFAYVNTGLGFILPVLDNNGMSNDIDGNNITCMTEDPEAPFLTILEYFLFRTTDFMEDAEAVREYYDSVVISMLSDEKFILEQEKVMIGSHPVRLVIGDMAGLDLTGTIEHIGLLIYARNNSALNMALVSGRMQEEYDPEEYVPPVLMSDLEIIAEKNIYKSGLCAIYVGGVSADSSIRRRRGNVTEEFALMRTI